MVNLFWPTICGQPPCNNPQTLILDKWHLYPGKQLSRPSRHVVPHVAAQSNGYTNGVSWCLQLGSNKANRESSSTKGWISQMTEASQTIKQVVSAQRRNILGSISSMNQRWTSWRLGITTFIMCCVWLEISHQTQLQIPPFQLSFPPFLVAFFSSVKDVWAQRCHPAMEGKVSSTSRAMQSEI